MTIERAMEILDPEHREQYESVGPVNEACRMGMDALKEKLDREAQAEAQAEVKLYERLIEKYGAGKVLYQAELALHDLLCDMEEVRWRRASAERQERMVRNRAAAEIALNVLSVIYGDCAEEECALLDELAEKAGVQM